MNNPFKRREQILELLETSNKPISGKQLSQQFDVSRQIIVKDISILKSQNHMITSTSRGYVINNEPQGKAYKRVIVCQHDNEQMEEELQIIIDNGAMINDVAIDHPVYGSIKADLMIETQDDLDKFISEMEKFEGQMLAHLTDNLHLHTISAHTEKILDNAVRDLKQHQYIVE
ncbi:MULTISPECIES: transcription repressor NadR [Mammaliicoccus]|uniref:transcription repressor NadR n=1 Tax=Mammaliicoccus TaxID=2803850 RepID=UPI001AADE1A0|nr:MULTISPECIES: transcription repressor NadR [Mammaliicoccus]MBO3061404.1 transcription repressor NadR [Mammaliicoccus fleurettii]MEB7724239.1 transcription repressor NadR [Mammaliicoccus fleurettii]MEB7779977.1 transcription repressor NadR [Mammaliicoccus fleurettii]